MYNKKASSFYSRLLATILEKQFSAIPISYSTREENGQLWALFDEMNDEFFMEIVSFPLRESAHLYLNYHIDKLFNIAHHINSFDNDRWHQAAIKYAESINEGNFSVNALVGIFDSTIQLIRERSYLYGLNFDTVVEQKKDPIKSLISYFTSTSKAFTVLENNDSDEPKDPLNLYANQKFLLLNHFGFFNTKEFKRIKIAKKRHLLIARILSSSADTAGDLLNELVNGNDKYSAKGDNLKRVNDLIKKIESDKE